MSFSLFQIKTTHYVCRTRHPSWEVSTEIIVGDFTKVRHTITFDQKISIIFEFAKKVIFKFLTFGDIKIV